MQWGADDDETYVNDDDETYINDVVLDSEHVVDGLERRDAWVARLVHLRGLVHYSNLSEDRNHDQRWSLMMVHLNI